MIHSGYTIPRDNRVFESITLAVTSNRVIRDGAIQSSEYEYGVRSSSGHFWGGIDDGVSLNPEVRRTSRLYSAIFIPGNITVHYRGPGRTEDIHSVLLAVIRLRRPDL